MTIQNSTSFSSKFTLYYFQKRKPLVTPTAYSNQGRATGLSVRVFFWDLLGDQGSVFFVGGVASRRLRYPLPRPLWRWFSFPVWWDMDSFPGGHFLGHQTTSITHRDLMAKLWTTYVSNLGGEGKGGEGMGGAGGNVGYKFRKVGVIREN